MSGAHESHPRFVVLHALRLRGVAPTSSVAAVGGMATEEAAAHLDELRRAEMVQRREGRVAGWSLTPAGREAHAEGLADDVAAARARERLGEVMGRFDELNGRLKQLCTDWQLRPGPDGALVPNPHDDRDYDGAVVGRLLTLHDDVRPLCDELAAALRRLAPYDPRLADAALAVAAGEHRRLATPLADSYHDVWMELHQDLLLTLGRERTAADA